MGNTKIPDLIDNRRVSQTTLKEVLTDLLQSATQPQFWVVTAYFNLSALEKLKDILNRITQMRLLLGSEQEQSFLLDERLRNELERSLTQAERGIPEALKRWTHFLAQDTVQVRRYTKGFLHGKAYLLTGVPVLGQAGIVGSSNFTGAGLESNLELNAVLKQQSATDELQRWFESLWEESEDYKAELLALLSAFTTAYSPYELYIKTLYESFRDRLQTDLKEKDDQPSPIALADFQRDGFLSAREILETYGGVLIADSVGLGKTFLALRLLDDYAYRSRETALVICPASIRDTVWRPLLEAHAIPNRIESMERISQSDAPIDELARYKVVVIDESHNFRNPNSNRWNNLFQIVSRGDPEKRVILMTATPVNNSVYDLYHQIRLLTRDQRDYFAVAGIPNLESYFRNADKNRDTLYELLEVVSVRRSRTFIRKNYPHAQIQGQRIQIPERVIHTVHYELEKSYGSDLYKRIANAIESLHLAPYQIDTYRKEVQRPQMSLFEELEGQLKDLLRKVGWTDQRIQELLMEIGRQSALANIMRVLYLKRLESSVEALRISLQRQHDFQTKFLQALKQGRLLTSKQYHRWLLQETSDDLDEPITDFEQYLETLPEVDLALYDGEAIQRAVEHDLNTLRGLLRELETLRPEHDQKLQRLKTLLTTELKDKKVLVFSYYKDTLRYLYKQLTSDTAFVAQRGGIERIALTDSQVKPEERRKIVARFSPRSNCPYRSENHHNPHTCSQCQPNDEIDLLFSTDVLSEGQNLQDAGVLINYDLPWNPVRMVQRIGRLDRIGSPHQQISVYNFIPEDALESLLRLMERLYQKLDSINRTVGLDASVLGEAPTPMDFNTLRRISEEDTSVLDELEAESELTIGEFLQEDLMAFLKQAGEERLERIPLGVGTAKQRAISDLGVSPEQGTGEDAGATSGLGISPKQGTGEDARATGFFVAFRHIPTQRHYWLFWNLDTNTIIDRQLEAIRYIRSTPDEPPAKLPEDFDPADYLERLREHLVQRLNQVAHRLPKLPSTQAQIVNYLHALPSSALRNELLAYLKTPLPNTILRQLTPLWRKIRGESSQTILNRLSEFARQNPRPPQTAPETPEVKPDEFECIAWMLVG